MVSYDAESLFTNIPVHNLYIDLAIGYIRQRSPDLKPTDEELLLATTATHLLFKGRFYEQIDRVAMGSPLAPLLANLFMGHDEKNWLEAYNGQLKNKSFERKRLWDCLQIY